MIMFLSCRITNKQRLCYLNSPIISQHLVLAHRDRINSIINSEDYQAMMINVVIEVSDQKQPIKITCKGKYTNIMTNINFNLGTKNAAQNTGLRRSSFQN